MGAEACGRNEPSPTGTGKPAPFKRAPVHVHPMNEKVPGNVGVLDEVVRYGLIAVILVAAWFALTRLGADWILFIIVVSGVSIGYLLLSSAAHVDFLYAALGVDTRHRRAR